MPEPSRAPRCPDSRVASVVRIPRRILLAAVAALSLSSCGALTPADEAFSVNGTATTRDRLDAVLSDLAAAGDLTLDNGEAGDEIVRTILRQLIRIETFRQFAEDEGLEVTDADREEILGFAAGDAAFRAYSDLLQGIIVDLNVIDLVLSRASARAAGELAVAYEESPASTGMLCLSHILVATRGDADRVLARLDEGADFAELAAEVSVEPAAVVSGGALAGADGEPCQPLTEFQRGYDGDFLAGAVQGRAGIPYGPVRTQFGWHVILNRPFADVADSLGRVSAAAPGAVAFEGYLADADVRVSSRYGRWVRGLSSIA
jgi:parvulin-like peptidyl-prolyl isomerase